jgi:pyruvate/2-oxoglutarate/acetoin dehydrogenase E1 component
LFGTLQAPVQRVGGAYCPVPFSKPLESAFMPGEAQIEAAVRKALR